MPLLWALRAIGPAGFEPTAVGLEGPIPFARKAAPLLPWATSGVNSGTRLARGWVSAEGIGRLNRPMAAASAAPGGVGLPEAQRAHSAAG